MYLHTYSLVQIQKKRKTRTVVWTLPIFFLLTMKSLLMKFFAFWQRKNNKMTNIHCKILHLEALFLLNNGSFLFSVYISFLRQMTNHWNDWMLFCDSVQHSLVNSCTNNKLKLNFKMHYAVKWYQGNCSWVDSFFVFFSLKYLKFFLHCVDRYLYALNLMYIF